MIYPFSISIYRCDGSTNSVEDPFGRVCNIRCKFESSQYDKKNVWIETLAKLNSCQWDVNLMVKTLIRNKNEITIDINVDVKNQ